MESDLPQDVLGHEISLNFFCDSGFQSLGGSFMFRVCAAFCLLFVLFLPKTTISAATSSDGSALARKWCSSCHLISLSQAEISDAVPSFREIARKRLTATTLRAFLSTPHTRMPDMSLTRQEQDALIRFINRQAK